MIPETQISPRKFGTHIANRHQLRSQQSVRAEAANLDNNITDTSKIGEAERPSTSSNNGVASLSTEAQQSVQLHLINPLKPILREKARATSKFLFLRKCVAHDNIPKGLKPTVPLKIIEAPTSLKEKWAKILKECSNKLIQALIDYHKSQISSNEELAHDTIVQASQIILPEFVADYPQITEVFEDNVENLITEANHPTIKPKKRKRKTSRTTHTSNKRAKPNPKNEVCPPTRGDTRKSLHLNKKSKKQKKD